VTGTVNPNGQATTWYFEYGTSTSYGSKTTDKNAGSGTSAVDVSAGSGLTPQKLCVNQPGAGYLAGISRTIVVHRG
jgi:hypothetical protein